MNVNYNPRDREAKKPGQKNFWAQQQNWRHQEHTNQKKTSKKYILTTFFPSIAWNIIETHMALTEQQNNSKLMNFKKIRSNSEQSQCTHFTFTPQTNDILSTSKTSRTKFSNIAFMGHNNKNKQNKS